MTILELKRDFKSALSPLYSERESTWLFQIFAQEIIGFDSVHLRWFQNQKVLMQDLEAFEKITKELCSGKPYQQILGFTEFYGLRFKVSSDVLIPRPETEELLEIAIDRLKFFLGKESRSFPMIDLGTGSGIIPIVLKKHFPSAHVSAVDVSPEALAIAKENAFSHALEIGFEQKDILQEQLDSSYDVILSNPPYIGQNEESELSESVKNFEPTIALFSPTVDPLLFYRRIAELTKAHLNKGGYLFLEINQKLGPETLALFTELLQEVHLLQDLSGNDRFIVGIK